MSASPEQTLPPADLEQRVAALEKSAKGKHTKKVNWVAWSSLQTRRELQSSREQEDSDLRAKMFEILSPPFFSEPLQARDKVLLPGWLENDFQNFNAGLLYDLLNSHLTNQDDQEAVRRMARAAASRQELAVGVVPFQTVTLVEDQSTNISLGQTNEVMLKVLEIQQQDWCVQLQVQTSAPHAAISDEFFFSVSYFDMPMTDSSELPDGNRFTVTLTHLDTNLVPATLRVIELKTNYLSSRNWQDIGQLTANWKKQIEGGN